MGMSKLNIMLGSFEGEEYLPPSSNGIATFRRNDFSFNEFCELSEQAKDLKSLYYIEDSLIKVCRKLKASDETLTVLKSVAKEVQKSNFVLHRVHKKTTKWNKSRNLRAVTNLQHKKGGIDVEVVISDKQGSILFSQQIVTNQFWHSVWFDFFKGGWDGSTFVIRSRVERETLVIDASEFQVT